ncbi:hypothetical protein MPSEU_000630200 [Mayamaea pseudoterrestris]|nr:hypothetical protein MPSEU_000630200 [Mayamaea pseudoterrestris]
MKSAFSFLVVLAMISSVIVQAVGSNERNYKLSKLEDVSEEDSYKSVLEHDAKRMHVLKTKLGEHQHELDAHSQGHRLLSSDEHAKLTHQSNLYARHLKQLADETKEDKLEKVREAKEFHQIHHMKKFADTMGN